MRSFHSEYLENKTLYSRVTSLKIVPNPKYICVKCYIFMICNAGYMYHIPSYVSDWWCEIYPMGFYLWVRALMAKLKFFLPQKVRHVI